MASLTSNESLIRLSFLYIETGNIHDGFIAIPPILSWQPVDPSCKAGPSKLAPPILGAWTGQSRRGYYNTMAIRRVAAPLLCRQSVRPGVSLLLGGRPASCVPVDDEIGGLTDDQRKVCVNSTSTKLLYLIK